MNDLTAGEMAITGTEARRHWTNRWREQFRASNPFYLASAGFVLYGLNRLSSDPRLTGAEVSLLSFNFSALFLYEILLVVTAIVLGRRAIWHDALLLVGLVNLFVLIPFSLVSRTVLLNRSLAWGMCLAAVVLAIAKLWALKRFLPWLNLSKRLLFFGAVVLAVNLGIVLGFQKFEFDKPALNTWLHWAWIWVLPLVSILALLLPTRVMAIVHGPSCRWFPELMFTLWIAVTAVHLGGVGYVYQFDWRLPLLAPTLWVLAWTWILRTTNLATSPVTPPATAYVWIPCAITFTGIADGFVFSILNILNFSVYALLWMRRRKRDRLLVLTLASFELFMAGFPSAWAKLLVPEFDRIVWICVSLAFVVTCLVIVIRDSRVAIFGAIAVFVLASWAWQRDDWVPLALQAALGFFLAHSLGWPEPQPKGAATIRGFFILLWAVHAYAWIGSEAGIATLTTGSIALFLLGLCCLKRWLNMHWPVFMLGGATAVLMAFPVQFLFSKLQLAAGHLSLLAGFLLFGVGTWLAVARSKWREESESER